MVNPLNLQTDVVRQHTVPRFLLKHFSTPGKGKRLRLYAFDKKNRLSYSTTPDDATVRNTFYNLDNHPERLSLEPLLGIYEHDAAPVIAALLERKDIRLLTKNERYKLAVFVEVQRARTFAEQLRITLLLSMLANKSSVIGATKEPVVDVLDILPEDISRDIFLCMLINPQPNINYLLKKDWYLLETTPEHPFYISDNPVVLQNGKASGSYGNLGLAVPGIEIYLPLSSTMILAMLCPSIRKQKIQEELKLRRNMENPPQLMPPHISERLKYLSQFKDYLLMPLQPEHVKRYNSLQVESAAQYVFCGKDNFSLIQQMLDNNERYQSGPRFMR